MHPLYHEREKSQDARKFRVKKKPFPRTPEKRFFIKCGDRGFEGHCHETRITCPFI
jgi:hypothetical protein